MALVTTNNQRTLAMLKKAAVPLAYKGDSLLYDNRRYVYDGINWILSKGNSKKKVSKDVIPHPGVLPGAVAAPVAYTRIIRGSKPKFSQIQGAVRITHREYISQVEGAVGGFHVNNDYGPNNDYSLNPMNFTVFNWLPTIAGNFDQYRFSNISLHYVPLIGTGEPGRVGLFFDKDSEDPGPDERAGLAAYRHLAEVAPWGEVRLPIPVDNAKRFVADNDTVDPKLVNLGKIGWAVYGGNSTNVYGDIFVQYTVELFEPQPVNTLQQDIAGTVADGATYRAGPAFITYELGSGTSITYQFRVPGTYTFTWNANVTASGIGAPTITPGATINGSFGVSNSPRTSYTANITVSRNANLTIPGLTGLTAWQAFVTKTTKADQVIVT